MRAKRVFQKYDWRLLAALVAALALLYVAPSARASCGAAFCAINTNWNMQGAAIEPGWRFDLRTEYIDQDQPMSNNSELDVGQKRQHHDEVQTKNRNVLAALDYAFNESMGLSLTVPVIDREHLHIHNHRGAQIRDSWDFTRLGDVRVMGRYQWSRNAPEGQDHANYGVNLGLKLPTGQTHVDNAKGDQAERSLQPGSGTTDLLLGAYYNRLLSGLDTSWFVQGMFQQPLNSHENYEPGHRISADFGWRYEATPKIGLLTQINLLLVERDRGAQAEPANTGGKFVYFSPGASFAVTPNAQLYGFVQLPLYQYVNGVQLTADWSLAAGVSVRF